MLLAWLVALENVKMVLFLLLKVCILLLIKVCTWDITFTYVVIISLSQSYLLHMLISIIRCMDSCFGQFQAIKIPIDKRCFS